MAAILDFSKKKKAVLPVKMPDGTLLSIYTPSKGMLKALVEISDDLDSAIGGELENLNQIYEIVAMLMSNNREQIEIDEAYLAKHFEIDDIVIFTNAYAQFVAEMSAEKN